MSIATAMWGNFLVCSVVCAGVATQPLTAQQRGAPPAQKEAVRPSFTCPDPLASKACKSFQELREAGDDAVKGSFANDGIAYACFRQAGDEFFVLMLEGPSFAKTHIDPQSKRRVPDDDASSIAFGYMTAFVNGIADQASIPINAFSGKWTPYFGDALS